MNIVARITFLIALLGFSLPASAFSPEGLWLVRDGRAKVKVENCKGKQLCAKIIWLRQPKDDAGRPLHDANNDNPELRKRPIIGLPVAYNMVQTHENRWAGMVYDPERGGTYKGSMTLQSDGRLKVTGCIGLFLCQSKFWKPLAAR